MKNFYIVKKSVKKNILDPKDKIGLVEFEELIDSKDCFIWFENTNHGIKKEKYSPSKKRVSAYLNYNLNDEKSYTQLVAPFNGFITIYFEYKVINRNLIDLIEIANSIDCNLWQYKPKQIIIDKAFAENYGNKKGKDKE